MAKNTIESTIDIDHVEAQLLETVGEPGFGPMVAASNALLALRALRAELERTIAERGRLRAALVKVVDDLVIFHPQADCLPEAQAAIAGEDMDAMTNLCRAVVTEVKEVRWLPLTRAPGATEEWQRYRKKKLQEMRPYRPGETLPWSVSISESDRSDGSPKAGDMIARNPKSHEDQWLVASDFFAENYEPAEEEATHGPEVERLRAALDRDQTGLAAALNRVRQNVNGWQWIAAGEWGSYEWDEQTVETLQREVGNLIDEVNRVCESALVASGTIANEALARDAAPLRQPGAWRGKVVMSPDFDAPLRDQWSAALMWAAAAFESDAKQAGLGMTFAHGPLRGASIHNVNMRAARELRKLAEAKPWETER